MSEPHTSVFNVEFCLYIHMYARPYNLSYQKSGTSNITYETFQS